MTKEKEILSVTLSIEDFCELTDDSDFLYALFEAGVENWDGYQEACLLYQNTYADNDADPDTITIQ